MQAPRAGRPEAAEAIWSGCEPGDRQPTAKASGRPRLRGSLQAAAAAAVGSVLWLHASQALGSVVLGVAVILLLTALLAPHSLYAAIERLFQALGRATGQAISWILLVPVFYLFFTPFGKLLRRGRRDRLRRRFEETAESYWEAHEGITAASSSHLRQY